MGVYIVYLPQKKIENVHNVHTSEPKFIFSTVYIVQCVQILAKIENGKYTHLFFFGGCVHFGVKNIHTHHPCVYCVYFSFWLKVNLDGFCNLFRDRKSDE